MKNSFASFRQLDHHDRVPVRIYPNREPDDYPAHWHMKYEIILPVEESYTALVDEKTYEILPGDIFLIPPGMIHEIFAPEKGMRYIVMADQDVVYAAEGLMEVQHFFYPCVHLRAGIDTEILDASSDYIWKAIREGEGSAPLRHTAVCSWLTLFLIAVGRGLLEMHGGSGSGDSPHDLNSTMLDIYAYITEHCTEKLTLETVAAYSGYSKYHFSRIFKEHTGISFYDFYLGRRMDLCRQILSDATVPITEVASRCGFSSIATFNRVFKQYEGLTPTQYRKMKQTHRA